MSLTPDEINHLLAILTDAHECPRCRNVAPLPLARVRAGVEALLRAFRAVEEAENGPPEALAAPVAAETTDPD